MSGKPKTPGTLRGMRRRKSGVARPTLTTPILKQVDDCTWARVDAVELEEEDPEEVKLPVFSSRALPPSPRTAPPSERPSSMNDATNTKWWTIRQPSPFVSARKTPNPSPAPSRERDENEIPTSVQLSTIWPRRESTVVCADPRAPLGPDAILPRGAS